jgi:predicted ATPase
MLKKLELHNFKNYHDTQINFDSSRLQAIVGQNSSGKTSILQALYLLSQIFHSQPVEIFDSQNAPGVIITTGKNDMFVTGSGFWENSSNYKDWKFSYGFDCIKSVNQNYLEPRRTWNIDGDEITDKGWQFLLETNDIPKDLELIVHLKLVLANLAKAGYSEEIVPEVQFDGSGLAPTLDYLRSEDPERFQSIQEMLKQIVPGVRKVGIRRAKVKIDRQRSIAVDGKSIAYEESQEVTGQEIVLDMNTGDRIPAHAISEGTMLTLGLLTVLMNPKQPNLVLLDDIEQGLHPKAQRELITVFKQIIQANPNLQIIFTTHSPYIIDELEPSQVHVLSNSKSGFTRAKRLDEHPDAEWAKQTLTTGEFWNAEGEDWVVDGDVND